MKKIIISFLFSLMAISILLGKVAAQQSEDENIKMVRKYNFGKGIAGSKGRPIVIKGHIYYAYEESDEVVIKRIKLN